MIKIIKILSIAFIGLCLNQAVLAYSGGRFYVGGQVGGGNLHYDNSELAKHAKTVSDKGFAGRLLAGFDINQNIGLELGYTLYQNPEFRYALSKTNFSQDSLDLLAKLSLPLSCNVSVYAKGGMAYVYRDDVETVIGNVTIKVDDKNQYLRPMLGVGVCYAFNCRVSGDLGYFRTFGTENLEDADFYGAGLTFKLG